MRIQNASYILIHKGVHYSVVFNVQVVSDNGTYCSVMVGRGDGTVLLNESTFGRQVISTWNAKRFLRKALIEKGLMKTKDNPV